jgi:hypothetical protein
LYFLWVFYFILVAGLRAGLSDPWPT